MDPSQAARLALELARENGFDLAGIAPLRPPRAAARFEAWLDAGRHGEMRWLERDRARITDPRSLARGGARGEARGSLLVVGLGHARPPVALAEGARVARYAAGRDYHNLLARGLRRLARALRRAGLAPGGRAIVDAGPLLERSHAAEAGLGFESKAANLLHRTHGPWFFLGELVLEVPLEPGPAPGPPAPAPGSCGTCTACLDACPTGAIVAPGELDARRCISYRTIEERGPVPHALRAEVSAWAFGCDVCSEVCPWGKGAPDASAALGTHAMVAEGSLADWLATPAEAFAERFRGSPLQRARRSGIARNAALGLSAAPSDEGRAALVAALADREALVREAAFWSLATAHAADRGTRAALERALATEPDPSAAADMRRTLESPHG